MYGAVSDGDHDARGLDSCLVKALGEGLAHILCMGMMASSLLASTCPGGLVVEGGGTPACGFPGLLLCGSFLSRLVLVSSGDLRGRLPARASPDLCSTCHSEGSWGSCLLHTGQLTGFGAQVCRSSGADLSMGGGVLVSLSRLVLGHRCLLGHLCHRADGDGVVLNWSCGRLGQGASLGLLVSIFPSFESPGLDLRVL